MHIFPTITDLTLHIKSLIERDLLIHNLEVAGEISNFTRHSSGNLYFTLKDAASQVKCMMPKRFAALMTENIQEGNKIKVWGNIEVYISDGSYQLKISKIEKSGQGDLHQQFEQLVEKLKKEGLFDAIHKRKIPKLPKRIGIITSPTGAAIQDMLRTLKIRYNCLKVIVIPTIVQGENGKKSIIDSLQKAELLQLDLILLGRGGGSMEDLWNFNEEAVARAIFACKIPIITGIGHETDFTIADFVSDYRAATPTAAAQKATEKEKSVILKWLQDQQKTLQTQTQNTLDARRQSLDNFSLRMENVLKQNLQKKKYEISEYQQQIRQSLAKYYEPKRLQLIQYENIIRQNTLNHLQEKRRELQQQENILVNILPKTLKNTQNELQNFAQIMEQMMQKSLQNKRHELSILSTKLNGLDITELLKLGYSLTLKNGKMIKSVAEIADNDEIETILEDGRIKSKVDLSNK